jgi:bifunctional ADP-heptose synthase (sugar kinase/adenylyltransferase)
MQPSRETGIPRRAVIRTEVSPGAAGTVANNLVALGVQTVAVLGAFGADGFGVELRQSLALRGIMSDLCVVTNKMQTFTYTKVINAEAGVEDQPRLDFINDVPLHADVDQQLAENLEWSAKDFDVILVSDQAETSQGGVVTPLLRSVLTQSAHRYVEKVFFVDSRERLDQFRGLTVKANEDEAAAACRRLEGELNYQALLRHTEAPLLLVTHGSRGVLVVNTEGQHWIETDPIDNPIDICGAGDSFSAGAAMNLAVTKSPLAAAHFGNLVASITIMKKGTGTASPQEVLEKEKKSHDRKRPKFLSITHKLGTELKAQSDVGKPRQTTPHHQVSGWTITGTRQVAAQPC